VGFVYLLLNQVVGKLTEEQQRVLETVYRNSEEHTGLVDNVLWMTSLNAGDASIDRGIRVAELIQRASTVPENSG
jgi:K+-sensing histidine kinase KdpD